MVSPMEHAINTLEREVRCWVTAWSAAGAVDGRHAVNVLAAELLRSAPHTKCRLSTEPAGLYSNNLILLSMGLTDLSLDICAADGDDQAVIVIDWTDTDGHTVYATAGDSVPVPDWLARALIDACTPRRHL